jgi:hypothetical protein
MRVSVDLLSTQLYIPAPKIKQVLPCHLIIYSRAIGSLRRIGNRTTADRDAGLHNVIPLLMGHPPLLATRVVHFPQFLSSSLSLSFTS